MIIKFQNDRGRLLSKKEVENNFIKLKECIQDILLDNTPPNYKGRTLGDLTCRKEGVVFKIYVLGYPRLHFVELCFYTATTIIDDSVVYTLTPDFRKKDKEYGFIVKIDFHTPQSLENFIIKTVGEWKIIQRGLSRLL